MKHTELYSVVVIVGLLVEPVADEVGDRFTAVVVVGLAVLIRNGMHPLTHGVADTGSGRSLRQHGLSQNCLSQTCYGTISVILPPGAPLGAATFYEAPTKLSGSLEG